ncbi:MAG TPA: inorganic diphosphatase [Solirubrobacter sp.]|nr:inorganic diphosphatase [Solirubrobacter sp.]
MFGAPMALPCLIEIPKGSRNKYEYDEALGGIKLDRFLFGSVVYPGDYGFIPETVGEDGDHLDAIVLVGEPTFPGCMILVRALGVLRLSDDDGRNDKVVCVPDEDPNWDGIDDIDDIPTQLRTEIEHFFSIYKQPEGKTVDVRGFESRATAEALIERARERFRVQ